MSAINFAKQALSALNSEKPHSSTTDWVEILTAHTVEDEAYDGIPELVDSINLQPTGPAEASRAIRKKLKHGDAHRQYRALVILKALVENGGTKFQKSFADNQLTDAIKQMAADPALDPKVRRKLTMVLASWYRQFKADASMSTVANLYKTTRDASGITLYDGSDTVKAQQAAQRDKEIQRELERQEAKERLKKEKEEAKKKKQAQKAQEKRPIKPQRRFDFAKEKPKVQNAIVEASQASNNLINAIQLVNRDEDNVQSNIRVQECLIALKQIRKQVVRYVQLVEDEEFIGTLIDTNERVIAALETYDNVCAAEQLGSKDNDPQSQQQTSFSHGELGKLQSKQRDRVARSINRSKESFVSPRAHPDLEDISFGNLGVSNTALQPPLQPSGPDSQSEEEQGRGSLSDYSDFDSSDEDEHNRAAAASTSADRRQRYSRQLLQGSDDDSNGIHDHNQALLDTSDDPFADPFADQEDVATPGITERKAMTWT